MSRLAFLGMETPTGDEAQQSGHGFYPLTAVQERGSNTGSQGVESNEEAETRVYTPGRIRTVGLLLRRQALYPLSYRRVYNLNIP